MAEVAVEERPPTRFYCHVCEVEFQNTTSNFTCPHCSDGFIEELQDIAESNNAQSLSDLMDVQNWEDEDMDQDSAGGNSMNALPRLGRTRADTRRIRLGARPRTLTRLASSNLRQQVPVENLIQDFIINLGVGVNWGEPGNVQLFLGNPGDYAWGREGLDAIVTQLLNQMDSTGPPPVSKAVIDALEVVEVTEEQVTANLQCSVCWEHFSFKEAVRQLPCQHVYHENCIRPWLELHGTCPICRQNLGNDNGEIVTGQDQSVEQATGQAASVQNVLRTIFGPSPNASPIPSSSNSMDHSGTTSQPRSRSDSMM
ncbi:E3 ubiquitin-protein ligase Iruka [Cylas formicarius]|uniref:E3 ubiquitin-protein ligase Iruka n=1 Tax=Cylas formicarius TaxID=197179 RepID=UPI002958451B|nr:E3 ubiquitin-protein ligase Iruka [Cylas formicarius]